MEGGGFDYQLDVSGLEVELPSLVDVSAGQAGVVDGEGPHRDVRLEVVLHVGPGIPDLVNKEKLSVSAAV